MLWRKGLNFPAPSVSSLWDETSAATHQWSTAELQHTTQPVLCSSRSALHHQNHLLYNATWNKATCAVSCWENYVLQAFTVIVWGSLQVTYTFSAALYFPCCNSLQVRCFVSSAALAVKSKNRRDVKTGGEWDYPEDRTISWHFTWHSLHLVLGYFNANDLKRSLQEGTFYCASNCLFTNRDR